MFLELTKYLNKPNLYEPSTDKFWDDEHISKGMLEAHLNPHNDGATRNHDFVTASVNWISSCFPPANYPKLLDLGCGPGIYAEKFKKAGYEVTGLDFSKRSIEYAIQNAKKNELTIQYKYGSYLELSSAEEFDVVTLIWCDYGVLSSEDRAVLLKNIYRALKPNGVLLFDIFADHVWNEKIEHKSYEHHPMGGFWNEKEHVCLNSLYPYENRIIVNQYIVMTQDKIDCYNLWEHYFTKEEIETELQQAGFSDTNMYSDVTGNEYTPTSKTICVVARK